MSLLNAIILGMVEGITEFLPISSTAHLIIASKFLNIPQTDFQKFFEVFIQSGAIFAVIILYLQYLIKHKGVVKDILFSFFPTAVVGFLLYKIIKTVFFESYFLIIVAMIFFGIIFLIIEYLISIKKLELKKPIQKVNWKDAVLIGLVQAIAVIPGVSRSGIVMATMMGMGYKRDESAIYSFLLAVPTILAASALDVYKMKSILFSVSQGNLLYLVVGFLVSFITAYLSMQWFISFLQKKTLSIFGWYRIIAGILLFIAGK